MTASAIDVLVIIWGIVLFGSLLMWVIWILVQCCICCFPKKQAPPPLEKKEEKREEEETDFKEDGESVYVTV